MAHVTRGAIALALLAALAACSGNFSSGQQGNPLPPGGVGGATPMSNGTAAPNAKNGSATPSPGPATYPLADAANGFACPETQPDFACQIRFNVPPPTPTPKPSKKKTPPPTASPSPSPAPTLNPSATPSPASTAPTITLMAEALPKESPVMVHVPKDVTKVTTLMTVAITTNADFPLDGLAIASFTLPKDQIPGRGFALQLFLQRMQGKAKTYAPVISLDKSSLQKNMLIFGFTAPKFTVAKNNTYVLVLYGTGIPSASASPAPTSSASPSPTTSP